MNHSFLGVAEESEGDLNEEVEDVVSGVLRIYNDFISWNSSGNYEYANFTGNIQYEINVNEGSSVIIDLMYSSGDVYLIFIG